MTRWRERLQEQKGAREKKKLGRQLVNVQRADGPSIKRADGTFIDLCSNDYLGLSRNAEVLEGAREAASCHGVGARASRLITGNYELLEDLECALAAFKGTETATVFPSGYQANLGVCSALIESGDAVFVDRLSHSCLVDGVRLSGARLRVFPHNDMGRLAELLERAKDAPARWILVDGVYSMDGDFSPLPELLQLAEKFDAAIILDDAHGTGVAGKLGRGTAEHFGIAPGDYADRLVMTATLSKALGSQGGVVLGAQDVRDAIVNGSRPFIYSTGLSPMGAGAAKAALELIIREPERVARLQENAREASFYLSCVIDVRKSDTPIIPVLLGEPETAIGASEALRERGILVLPVRPPTVPKGTSRLRLTITSEFGINELRECMRNVAEACLSFLAQPPLTRTLAVEGKTEISEN